MRTFLFILTVGVLQLAALGFTILDGRIRAKRVSKTFLGVLGAGISAFAVAMLMVSLGFTFPHQFFELNIYWRIVTALGVTSAILIVITLMSRALNPVAATQVTTQVQPQVAHTQPQTQVPVTTFPAGWYPTENSSMERFWDGSNWTSYTRPTGFDDEQPPVVKGESN